MTYKPTHKLRAGAAEVDITPKLGTHLGGDAARLRPVDKVLDPLYCRALVAENDDPATGEARRVCVIAMDLCVEGNEAATEIRTMVAQRFGFDVEAVMLHLLQNHSAPSLGGHLYLKPEGEYVSDEFWWVYSGDPEYGQWVRPKIIEAVEQAIAKLEPVTVSCHGMLDGRATFNRRFIMRDGWVMSQAGDRSKILRPEGPADAEVGVALLTNQAGKVTAGLLNYTAHPVSHFSTNWVTASWPGKWADRAKAEFGEGFVPFVTNGCCGNINPVDNTTPGGRPDDDQIGDWLIETTRLAVDQMPAGESSVVDYAGRVLELPFGDFVSQVGQDSIDHARQVLEKEPTPRWKNDEHTYLDIEWCFSVIVLDLHRRMASGSYDYFVQTMRIGDLALVGLTGEPFVEGQLAIKQRSAAKRTFVAHMANGFGGYIPTTHAYHAKNVNFFTPDGRPVRRGANLFLFEPDALDRITDASVELIEGLFTDH